VKWLRFVFSSFPLSSLEVFHRKRAIPTGVLTGKPDMRGGGQRTQPLGIRLRLLESIADLLDKSMPLAGPGAVWHNTSADIAHDASCGPLMPSPRGATGRALSAPDAAHTAGTLIPAAHPCRAAGRGGSQPAPRNARGRHTCARSAGRAGVPCRCGRAHPAKPGDARVHGRRARRARCSPAAA
jgi:hypothetical protein